MERVKRAPRARKRAEIKESLDQATTVDADGVATVDMAKYGQKLAEKPTPARPRTWWELLRS